MPAPPSDDRGRLGAHALSGPELQELLAVQRAGRPFLVYRDEAGALELFVVPDEDRDCTIGRRAETDISISWDGEVSGLHAELRTRGGEVAILDDGLSKNGTFVNSKEVAGQQRLRDGDLVRVGRTVLVYRTAALEAVEETIAAPTPLPHVQLTKMQREVLRSLCRPYRDDTSFARPATNPQIAKELSLSVEAVKMHLRTLFAKFALGRLPPGEKRTKLVERALESGIITRRDLA